MMIMRRLAQSCLSSSPSKTLMIPQQFTRCLHTLKDSKTPTIQRPTPIISASVAPVAPRFMSMETQRAVEQFASYKLNPVSLKQLTDFGLDADLDTQKAALKFLRDELPTRLGHMIKEFDELPDCLLDRPPVRKVRGFYVNTFQELLSLPDPSNLKTAEELARFNTFFKTMLRKHDPVVTLMAQGVLEVKQSSNSAAKESLETIQYFLDRFYMSRLGFRTLVGQYLDLFDNPNISPSIEGDSKIIGSVHKEFDVRQVIEDAAYNASSICSMNYATAPGVKIVTMSDKDEPIKFTYPISHLHHILFELLKNSMRAMVEHPQYVSGGTPFPPIQVTVAEGASDLTIRVSDRGGGIALADMPRIWTYLFTTATPPPLGEDFNADTTHAPLAGFGYGLPLSRLYTRYLGGDLQVNSMEGFGTDAYIYLKRCSSSAREVLPSYNCASVGNFDPNMLKFDWMNSKQSFL